MASKAESIKRASGPQSLQRVKLSQSVVAGAVAALDALIIGGMGLLIFWLYVAAGDPQWIAAYTISIGLFTCLTLQAFALAGLYRFIRIIHPVQQVTRIVAIILAMLLLLLACVFALKMSEQFSRVWAFTWLGTMVLLLPVGRLVSARVIGRLAVRGRLGRNIVIVGGGDQGASLIRHIEAMHEPWNRIVGVFDDRSTRNATEILGYPILGTLEDLIAWSRDHRADEVLIAMPWGASDRLMSITQVLAVLPADVRLSPEFVGADFLHRQTSFQYGVPMLSVLERPVSGWSAIAKQTLDYVVGGLLTLLLLPILVLIALWIRLDSRGPILFRQKRYGFNHQLIEVFKFRTMRIEATDEKAEQLTRPGDPRITRAGRFLRRYSLDELPQLFNVLRGEMSLVGPRPHAVAAKAGDTLYEEVIDQYARRHRVKPGITGWAQVNGWRGNTATEADLLGRLEHDLYYIDNWSVLFDLGILLRTVFAVLKGENSY